jgi:hypothetical protein
MVIKEQSKYNIAAYNRTKAKVLTPLFGIKFLISPDTCGVKKTSSTNIAIKTKAQH